MLFLVPQGQFQKHLHTLAKIAKLLHKKEFRQALEEAPNDAAAMFGPPSFEAAAFKLSPRASYIPIKIRYFP